MGERELSRSTGHGVAETGCRDALEARQRGLEIAAHAASDDVSIELGPDDRGDVEDGEVGVGHERISPGEHGVQRRGRAASAAGDLDDEQGVTAGLVGDGRGVGRGSEPGEQVGNIGRRQPAEINVVDSRHSGEIAEQHAQLVIDVGCGVAGGDQHQDRGVDRRAGDVAHRCPGRRGGEMEVLDDEQQRSSLGSSPQVATDSGRDRRLPRHRVGIVGRRDNSGPSRGQG